jgi:4-hydroxy-tetrahydrodipicolinate synthase
MKLDNFKLWTALITPMTPGLKVDFDSLAALVNEQTEAKNGLLILGSTGEALNLDLKTKKSIVEFVISLKPSTPVMIGVGGHDLTDQLSWCEWLETKSIDAYLMVTPIYSKPNHGGQYRWFKTLMDAVKKPVMLYNVPSRAGSWLSLEAVKKLSTHSNFWAIKEAGGSVEKFKEYLDATDNGSVYCGDDGLMSNFANAGACGLVSVASNVWPAATNKYVEKCLDKSLDAASMWTESCDSLFVASNPIPAKALLTIENRIKHNTMMPPLYEGDLKDLGLLKRSSENINAWFKNNK